MSVVFYGEKSFCSNLSQDSQIELKIEQLGNKSREANRTKLIEDVSQPNFAPYAWQSCQYLSIPSLKCCRRIWHCCRQRCCRQCCCRRHQCRRCWRRRRCRQMKRRKSAPPATNKSWTISSTKDEKSSWKTKVFFFFSWLLGTIEKLLFLPPLVGWRPILLINFLLIETFVVYRIKNGLLITNSANICSTALLGSNLSLFFFDSKDEIFFCKSRLWTQFLSDASELSATRLKARYFSKGFCLHDSGLSASLPIRRSWRKEHNQYKNLILCSSRLFCR